MFNSFYAAVFDAKFMHIRPTDGRCWAASFIVPFMRVILAGGGTGGHVIPAIAIAQELQKRYGAEGLFIGTARGLQNRLGPVAGCPQQLVKARALNRVRFAT